MPNWRSMGWRGTSLWRFYLKKQLHYLEIDLSQWKLKKKMLANEQIVHDVCNNVWWARQYNLLLYYDHLIWQQEGKKPDITYLFHVNYFPNCVNVPPFTAIFIRFLYVFLVFIFFPYACRNALCAGLFKLNSVFLSCLSTDVFLLIYYIEVYNEVIWCLSKMWYLWI